jgi:hypothetical protein
LVQAGLRVLAEAIQGGPEQRGDVASEVLLTVTF